MARSSNNGWDFLEKETMPKLYIVRGLPGSGKSTFAKNIGCFHVETDMFFMKSGKYEYDSTVIRKGHEWCSNMVTQAMIHGVDIVVSNTFTQLWEFKRYIELAVTFGYDVSVCRAVGNYDNTHSVPEDVLEKMKSRFEDYPDEQILNCGGSWKI